VIVIDTSGIVALLDRSDTNHARALGVLQRERQSILVPTGIMAEIAYVVQARAGERAVLTFLESIMIGTTQWSCGEDDLPRVRDLMVRYADLPLGYADATVVACAERSGGQVLTFDLRHIGLVAREGRITIVP
jgi:predicted nucleic acid-binding protein